MDKSTPSLEEKKAIPNCGNKDGNIIHVLTNCISTCCNSFEVYETTVHMSLLFGDSFLAEDLHLKSHHMLKH